MGVILGTFTNIQAVFRILNFACVTGMHTGFGVYFASLTTFRNMLEGIPIAHRLLPCILSLFACKLFVSGLPACVKHPTAPT